MDKMLFLLLLCYLSLPARCQEADDDWLDPYDMLNYDSSTKTMKKPPEVGLIHKLVECYEKYGDVSGSGAVFSLWVCYFPANNLYQCGHQKKRVRPGPEPG